MVLDIALEIIAENWIIVPLIVLVFVAWYIGAFSSAQADEVEFEGGAYFY